MFMSLRIDGDLSRIAKMPDLEIQKKKLQKQNEESLYEINQYLIGKDNAIDASKIISCLYPQKQCDIFISHSHKDENDVLDLKFKLELLGLKVFVDSVVWGNSEKMLKSIDEEFCAKTKNNYDYDKRNRSTANVYLMLNSALQQMIDQCEVFIFLGTENTLSMENYINNEESLMSPWIFSELAFSRSVRRTLPIRQENLLSLEESKDNTVCDSAIMNFIYHTPMLDKKMYLSDFLHWSTLMYDKGIKGNSTLDYLYRKLMDNSSLPLDELYKKMIDF